MCPTLQEAHLKSLSLSHTLPIYLTPSFKMLLVKRSIKSKYIFSEFKMRFLGWLKFLRLTVFFQKMGFLLKSLKFEILGFKFRVGLNNSLWIQITLNIFKLWIQQCNYSSKMSFQCPIFSKINTIVTPYLNLKLHHCTLFN